MHDSESKEEIRARIAAVRKSLPKEKISSDSSLIAEKLYLLREYENADIIFIYNGYSSEVQTAGIINQALAAGKTVALPKVQQDGYMEFFTISDLSDLKPGFRGIMEPDGSDPTHIFPDIMIIPGLAFDIFGNRLGHGKGYYDRYLSTIPNTVTVGLAFDEQIVSSIPAEITDVRIGTIITPTRIIKAKNG